MFDVLKMFPFTDIDVNCLLMFSGKSLVVFDGWIYCMVLFGVRFTGLHIEVQANI